MAALSVLPGRELAAQPAVRGRAALSARPSWALGDSIDADAIVRVVIENGPQTTLIALGRDTLLMLPVRQLFSMLEVAITDDVPDKRLLGLVHPDRPAAGFDTERGLLYGGVTPVPFAKDAVMWQQGELYASAALIADALQVRVEVDQSSLTITFLAVRDLPVLRRLERQRARVAALRSGATLPSGIPIVDRPAVFGGFLVDWSFLSPIESPTNLASARLTLGAQLLGGGLEVQQQQFGDASFLRGQTTWSWTRAWQENAYVRQLGVGTLAVPGRRSRQIDGALITNVPYFRPADYSTAWLDGVVPAGWDVELQRYGLPLANVRPDASGAWRFEVPVSYGPNEVELMAYGPGGVSRRWRANVVVPFERLSRGRFEYVAAGGACRLDLCERAATLDLRYGITEQLTVQGGTTEYGLAGGRSISNPFLLAAYAVRPDLNMIAEHVQGGYTRAELDYQPTTDFRVTLSAADLDTTIASLFVNRQRAQARRDARIFWRPTEENRGFWFALQLSHEVRGVVTTSTQQLSASYLRGPVRVQGGLILDRTQLAGAASAFARQRADVTVESSQLSPWRVTRGWYGRASTLIESDGSLSQVTASLSNAMSRRFRFETGLQWVRGLSTPVATFQMQTNFAAFQAVSTMQQASGRVVGGQMLSGTAGFDVGARTFTVGNELNNGRGVGYGAVQIDAFLDANGNGQRDPLEAAVPNLRVTVGSQSATTDAAGAALVRTLNAYVASYVEVDTAALPNPMWIVERPVVGLIVRPNSATQLAIPVRPAGGVIGRLEYSDGAIGPTGAEIELVHVETREARRVVTFADGSFESFKLRPGRWEVRPSNATLRRTQSRADVVVVDVAPVGAEGFLETVTLQLLPVLLAPPTVRLPSVPRLAPWTPDTARRLDLPVPARPRRSALAAFVRAAPSAIEPVAPVGTLAPSASRARPSDALTPDARPTVPRPRAVRPVPGADLPSSAPRLAPRSAPTVPLVPPARPLTPDARPIPSRPRPAVPAPSSRAAAPETRGAAVTPRAASPVVPRPEAPRARSTAAAPLTPDARPSTPRPRARGTPASGGVAAPRATPVGPARPPVKSPARGTTVRPED